ncbi:MAG: thioredoxin family protein [Pirellulaceae bacterium]|nr:thioredoxin family protein [Pirellulaceae bacterium]
MIVWTAILSVQLGVVGWGGSEYQEAYAEADRDGKPLLVLVGAEWCPGCRTMKEEMLPQLRREGGLADVVFTTVDTDYKPTLSRRLLRGNSIPQLVMFTRGKRGWRRSQLTGVHAPELIREFIRTEMVTAGSVGDTVPASAERPGTTPLDASSTVH